MTSRNEKSDQFFSQIVYSSSNEDGRSELSALNLSHHDDVLAVTGSGSRVLELLLGNPKTVTAIDFNQNQNFLLALKICALRNLGNHDFLRFIGLLETNADTRMDLYRQFNKFLSFDQKSYWDKNIHHIKSGILFCGIWEKYIKLLSKFMFFKKNILHSLWAAKDLSEQIKIWESHWQGRFWNWSLKLIAQRFLWKHVIKEPGIYCVPSDFNIFKYMNHCFEKFVHTQLLRDSFFAQMIFYGRLSVTRTLPLYLQDNNLNIIRERLDRVRIVHADLNIFLNHQISEQAFDAYSLSDFSSYASKKIYDSIWNGVLRTGRSGARVCERQFLVKCALQANPRFERNLNLEEKLTKSDSSFIYSFVCGNVL